MAPKPHRFWNFKKCLFCHIFLYPSLYHVDFQPIWKRGKNYLTTKRSSFTSNSKFKKVKNISSKLMFHKQFTNYATLLRSRPYDRAVRQFDDLCNLSTHGNAVFSSQWRDDWWAIWFLRWNHNTWCPWRSDIVIFFNNNGKLLRQKGNKDHMCVTNIDLKKEKKTSKFMCIKKSDSKLCLIIFINFSGRGHNNDI